MVVFCVLDLPLIGPAIQEESMSSEPGLKVILDFILNRADEAELEVIAKALERRRQDMARFAGMGGLNPGALAERMAASINQGVQGSMDSLRLTVRNYVEQIIRRNAPEASEDQIEELLDHYVGDAEARVLGEQGNDAPGFVAGAGSRTAGLVDYDGGLPDTQLPPEALLLMVRDFYDYSLGLMPPSKQKELWDAMPRWQELYWEAFPAELKALIKARLEERLTEEDFWRAILSLLGL
jgi:hypothetical protein